MFGEPSATCRGGRVSVFFRVFRGSKKIYTFEFLGLATMLLPALMAGVIFRYRWLDVFDNLPHVLWNDNAK